MKTSSFNLFKKPSAQQLATDSLEEAKRCLLVYQAAAAYNTKMAEYYEETIVRLHKTIYSNQ